MFRGERITVNARALAGVAHTSSIATSYLDQPLAFGSTNWFAASVGGSVDYRVSHRWSYRIIQPELLTTITNKGGTVRAYPNLRVSTGLVFNFGQL